MPPVHDATFRDTLRSRLKALRPDAQRKWGSMSADQMLWHVASGLELALGRRTGTSPKVPPLPKPLLRFLVLKAPWPHGAPTIPEIVAKEHYDFETQRARCIQLLDEVGKTDVNGTWPVHPTLGKMSGKQYSELHGKHVDHHLKQFGA